MKRLLLFRNSFTHHDLSLIPKKSFSIRSIGSNIVRTSSTSFCHKRNIRYSNQHERNILDIYEPQSQQFAKTTISENQQPTCFIFVHGGLWMRGSKEDSPIQSYWDFTTSLFSHFRSQNYTTKTLHNDSNNINDKNNSNKHDKNENNIELEQDLPHQQQPNSCSNVGISMASQGFLTYVINYRLANNENYQDDSVLAHPHQVMDVARAVAYVIRCHVHNHHNNTDTTSQQEQYCRHPFIYICGHSAGGHLSALALSDTKYIQLALLEQGFENPTRILQQTIAGFIGISAPYNIPRLSRSPFADIIIHHAFLGKHANDDNDDLNTNNIKQVDTLKDASPLHVLLSGLNSETQSSPSSPKNVQHLLPYIPVLLLNAEHDFHLHQDAKEIMVALNRFENSSINPNNSVSFKSTSQTSTQIMVRKHEIIQNRDHLSIMWKYGEGYFDSRYCKKSNHEYRDESINKDDEGDGMVSSIKHQVSTIIDTASTMFRSYVNFENNDERAEQQDSTVTEILNFISATKFSRQNK